MRVNILNEKNEETMQLIKINNMLIFKSYLYFNNAGVIIINGQNNNAIGKSTK
jgi:hypothetical protein